MATKNRQGKTHEGGKCTMESPFEIIDSRFRRYALGNVFVEKLHTGMRWAEGPVWFGDGGHLIWSDIPNNRMMRWQQFSFWRPDKIGDSGRDGFLIQDRDGDAVPPSELAAAVL